MVNREPQISPQTWRWLVRASQLIACAYLAARAATLPALDLDVFHLASWTLLAFEVALAWLMLPEHRRIARPLDRSAETDAHAGWYGDEPPLVDVFIPTYNEAWEVLERTIAGAKRIDYPAYRIWLLDDGVRDWLRVRARELGVGYLARELREHAKAGNLNHALGHVRALDRAPAFVCVFDADFVPQPAFLRRTVALMHDPRVGIVQTPQWFYNADPFQQALGDTAAWPDEQRFWFDYRLPALDRVGYATCCGTSCLIRVAALDAIGGFPTGSLSEDTWASLQMRGHGFLTHYLNEPLSWGLAPEGLHEYLTQRSRWLLGGLQILRLTTGERGGGSVLDRLRLAVRLWAAPISAVVLIAWLVLPALYLLTGRYIVEPSAAPLLVAALALVHADRAACLWWSGGRYGLVLYEAHCTVQAWMWLSTGIRGNLFPGRPAFAVTAKAITRTGTTIYWATLRWLLALVTLYAIAAGYALAIAPARDPVLGWWNAWHLVYGAVLLCAAIVPTIEPVQRRVHDRFIAGEPVTVATAERVVTARLRQLGAGGAIVELASPPPPGAALAITLAGLAPLAAVVKRAVGPDRIAIEFTFGSSEREALIARIYVGGRYVRLVRRWTLGRSLAALARHVTRRSRS